MKQNFAPILLLTALCWLTAPGALRATPQDALTPTVAPAASDNIPVSQEFTAESSITGRSTTKQGSASLGGVSNINSHFNYVVSPQIKDGVLLRFGIDSERNSFGLFPNAPLPNTLQSVNAIVGVDLALSDKIIMRAELHPGIFSDFVNITGSDFD